MTSATLHGNIIMHSVKRLVLPMQLPLLVNANSFHEAR
jgi:hypothetical protein